MIELFRQEKVIRKKPLNISIGDEGFYKHEYEVDIPPSHYVILKDAYLLADSIFSFSTFRFYWQYTHFNIPSLRSKLSRLRLLLKKNNHRAKAIWVANEWSEGYFHWLTDALPRYLAVKERTDCKEIILPEKYARQPFVDASASMLGFSVSYYKEGYPCKVHELVLPSYTAPTGNYNITLIRQLRELLTPVVRCLPGRRIYISRKKAKFRKILNEDEVEQVLKQFNFEVHCFEDYSLQEQIGIMHAAEVLVGLHGAGLTNMLFMQKGTKVFELRNENDKMNNCYFSLASALDIAYYYQFNKGDSKETYNVGITVDLNKLRENLQSMLS